jgi:heptosyltransferase II
MSTKQKTQGGTLVVQPLPGIGDTIWHLPHLLSIAGASSDRSITVLTKERSLAKDLLVAADHVRDVLYLAPDGGRHSGPLGGWRLGEDLRAHDFGTVWILHGSSRYAVAACRAGIPKRIGFGIGWQDALLTSPHGLSRRDRSLSSIEKSNRLLEVHDIPVSSSLPVLPLTDAARHFADATLSNAPRPAVALAIGSSETFKQWGAANFVDLIKTLRKDHDYSIVLVGGADDTAISDHLAEHLEFPPWLIRVIDAPILNAAAVVAECAACIGNDTGMLQVAAAVDTPSLGLFGGSVPLHQDSRISTLSPPGRLRHGKNRMAEISVDMVVDLFRRLDLGLG